MITYRTATGMDWENIAKLHTESWQLNYRGMWEDAYLDGPVLEDRRSVWQKRFEKAEDKRLILLAEKGKQLAGFACSFLDHDPEYGAFLDNLHVSHVFKRKGIGRVLMKNSARWLYDRNPDSPLYLWVLEENIPAIKFYERLGGMIRETIGVKTPYGAYSPTLRMVWPDLQVLL